MGDGEGLESLGRPDKYCTPPLHDCARTSWADVQLHDIASYQCIILLARQYDFYNATIHDVDFAEDGITATDHGPKTMTGVHQAQFLAEFTIEQATKARKEGNKHTGADPDDEGATRTATVHFKDANDESTVSIALYAPGDESPMSSATHQPDHTGGVDANMGTAGHGT